MDKLVLLLGASSDQLFAIKTAHQMGVKVLAVDMNPDSIGFKHADDFEIVSTRDTDALIDFIESYQKNKRKIDGVITMGSDIPDIISILAEKFGWIGPSKETAYWGTNKLAMKKRFKETGIPIPYFSEIIDLTDLKNKIEVIGLPCIIKPVDRSGSRGVFKIEELDNIEELYHEAKNISFSGKIMLEKYIEGLQISTESVIYHNKSATPGFADRNYEMLNRFAPRIIENGGTVPTSLSKNDFEAVVKLVEKAGRALGVKEGIVKGDVVMSENGPMMIEMAVRLSGGDFSESLIPLGNGVNIVEAAINISLGIEPDFDKLQPKFNKGVVNRYLFPDEGKYVKITNIEELRSKDWIKKFEIFVKEGEDYKNPTSHANRFGVFIAVGETREEAIERSNWVYDNIKFEFQ